MSQQKKHKKNTQEKTQEKKENKEVNLTDIMERFGSSLQCFLIGHIFR